MLCAYSHYLPLITRCPLSIFPDFGYVTIETNEMIEIFKLRKIIFSHFWKKIYIEDLVESIEEKITEAFKTIEIYKTTLKITYCLIGGRIKIVSNK